MQQREFTSLVAEETGLTRADCKRVVDATFLVLGSVLARGDRIVVPRFGVFCVKRRSARIRRNPRTGEAIPMPADAVPIFKPSKGLRELVNGSGPGHGP